MWNMTRKCNFRCSYCYYPHDASPVTENLPVGRILDLLGRGGGEWTVGMTGGEPLLCPGFVDICQALTREHLIGVDSNLSVTSRVREFGERIDPARTAYLYVSLHIEERERVKGVDSFIENVLFLKERGFRVIVNSVLHPSLISRFAADREYFSSRGVEIVPRPFKGEYQGRRYPESYGPEARDAFSHHPEAGRKMVFNFKGVPCHGGMTFIRMEPDGTVFRCSGDRTVIGNLMDEVHLNERPEPCAVKKCPCRGLDYVILGPAQQAFVDGLTASVVGDPKGARGAYEKCLALDPAMSNAMNNLGVLDWEEGGAESAVERFEKALAMQPDHVLYGKNLEAARFKGGAAPKTSNEVAPGGAGNREDGAC